VAPGHTSVGIGFDAHRFSPDEDRPLVLGGLTLPGPGLEGHSDGDVVAHACADALLGAAGMGDLGDHFPSSRTELSGADSLRLLSTVVHMLSDAGWSVRNIDCVVIAAKPRLGELKRAMSEKLASVVGAPVHVKATTTDGLGALGRGEGIACSAVALVEKS
jgi:2-C-methyl-D-erythritol 2,4-cyclodiphosphate synthase